MKITRVIPRIVRRDMGGRVWNPRTRWQEKVMVLVFLEADSGHLGVGEAWNTAASPQALVATIEDDLAPLVIGEDPFFVERVWQRAFRPTELSSRTGIVAAALSAVDIALWDLMGQALGLPLYRVLGAHADEVEYHMLHQWLWDRVPAGTFAPRQGFVRPPGGPGLGLALTPDDV